MRFDFTTNPKQLDNNINGDGLFTFSIVCVDVLFEDLERNEMYFLISYRTGGSRE